MDYQKIYNSLIDNATHRILITSFERHHIVPVSMGGSNLKTNLVNLTPREHFIAHMLLWRIHRNVSMSYALWQMSHTRGQRINGRMYEVLRSQIASQVSKLMTNRIVTQVTRDKMSKSFTGRIFTQEHRDNIGKSSKGRKNPMKGKSFNLSDEEIKRRSDFRIGKNTGVDNVMHDAAVKATHLASVNTVEYKAKISAAGLGHRPYNFKRVSVKGIEYNTATEAAKLIGITYNSLIRRIRMEKYIDYFYL